MSTDTLRGTGRTSKQIQALAQGGVFICAHQGHAQYVKALARFLGRTDVRIETADWIVDGRWRGLTLTDLGVDHHVFDEMNRLPRDFSLRLNECLCRVR